MRKLAHRLALLHLQDLHVVRIDIESVPGLPKGTLAFALASNPLDTKFLEKPKHIYTSRPFNRINEFRLEFSQL